MGRKKLLITIGVLLFGIFLFFYFTGGDKRKFFNWYENYRIDSKQPYGLYIFFQLLETHFNGNFTVLESSVAANLSRDQKNSLYVLIGSGAYFKSQDIDTLKSFVAEGNTVFIASKAFPFNISHQILTRECGVVSTLPAKKVMMKLEGHAEEHQYTFVVNQKEKDYHWNYIDSLSCLDKLQPLGYFDEDKANFLRVTHGNGFFYFCTTPLIFTNYYLKQEGKLEHVEAMMTYFPATNIYWDEYSKLPFQDRSGHNSPLKYILSQPALQWAWYVLLAAVLIYFLFSTRRRQRIIPVLESNKNTAIEFAETMGYLYFEAQNHKNIADHKMNLFLNYIRNKYHLHTNRVDDDLAKKVSLKSGRPLEEVAHIFKTYQRLDFKVEITAQDLIGFHDLIESFYQNVNNIHNGRKFTS